MQSLVNQRLVLDEARRLGISTSEAEVEEAMRSLPDEGISLDVLEGVGGLDAFKRRLQTRLAFERVKATVTKDVVVSDADLNQYIDRYRSLFDLSDRGAVEAQVEPAVRQGLVDRAWSTWLEARMGCSLIQVLLHGAELPAVTPHAAC